MEIDLTFTVSIKQANKPGARQLNTFQCSLRVHAEVIFASFNLTGAHAMKV